MSGHSKWSSIKHKKGAADAKRGQLFSKLSRAIIVAAKEGGPDPARQPRAAERDREGALVLDAEGQHRARDREGLRRGRRRLELRDGRLRGLRPGGRRRARRGADRQPQPHRVRGAARVHEARRQPRHDRGRRVAVRAARRRRSSSAEGADEDELVLAAAEAGADDVELDGSSFVVTSAPEALSRGARGARGGRLRGRVGRARDGAEDDRRGRRTSPPRAGS